MSVKDDMLEKDARVYDNHGRTLIPSKVMDALDIKEGDRIVFMVVNGELKVTINKKRDQE